MAEGSNGRNIAAWVLSVALAALFFFAAYAKLASTEEVASAFGKFGYPLWFSYVVGLAELGGALLLLAPKVASYAAGILIVVMVGAIISTLRVGESPLFPAVVLILLAVVALLRRPQGA